MELRIEDEDVIRRYLLGQLSEDEREQFEKRMMTDNDLYDRLLLAEDEMVEDYIENKLPNREQEAFKSSYLSTADGQKRVSFEKDLREYAAKKGSTARQKVTVARWHQVFFGSYGRLAAAAIILVGIALGIWRIFFYQSDVSKGIAALAYAYREQRPVEARITGFDYAPAANTRGGEEKVDRVARNRAERILLDEVSEHPNAASYHALGRLYLAERKFDDAIAQFEEALKTDPNNAQLHSDYGAALMEKGKADESSETPGNSVEEIANALQHFTKALELNGNLLEPLFNRSLCLQQLKLLQQAQESWREYLRRDSSSKWADEARQNLKQLEERSYNDIQNKEQLFHEFIDAYRGGDDNTAWTIASQNKEALSGKSISERLIASYLDSALQNETKQASEMLGAISFLGELESRRGGDSYTAGIAEFYRSLTRPQLPQLDRARKLMELGKSHYLQAKNQQAIEAYSKARQIYQLLGDEGEAELAGYFIAYSYPDKADIQSSKRMYEELSRSYEKRNFKWLLMRVQMGLSVVSFSLNNCSMAIKSASRSLDLAKEMNDANGALNAFSCLIEYYRYVGSHHEALRCVQLSLPFIRPESLGIVQIWRHCAIIASALNSAGFYAAAIDCQREALILAQRTSNAATLSVSYVHLGLMLGRAGNFDEAIQNVQLAYEAARSCPDEGVRKNQMAYAALQMGHLNRQLANFGKALENYDESIDDYKSLEFPTFLYQAHKGKLICYIGQHDDVKTSEEIQTTLEMAERYRSTILEEENRNNFFDVEQSLYDLAADFEYSRMKASERAFEYSEQSRARSLLDSLNSQVKASPTRGTDNSGFQSVSQPLSLASIRQRMPSETQILQYSVLPKKILIWIITTDDFIPSESVIDQNDLNRKVGDYLEAISGTVRVDSRETSRRARELFGILILGIESHLNKDKQLCIVPDKVLTALPFAALISDRNDYLLRVYAITYSPSASVFVLCSEQAKRKEHARIDRILSIGNPRFDRTKFPLLPDLSSAATEAEVVAECYGQGSSELLVGKDARKSVVQSEIPKFEIVHLALHSVLDKSSPMHSKLILAANSVGSNEADDSDGVLESLEICKLNLPRTRLIVLSACHTASDRYFAGEGMFSIARSFLVARVPLTVASLWAVDSDSTKELMIRFHKWRRAGDISTAEALRRAQLSMIDEPDNRYRDPYYWASFVAIGGQTSF